MKNDTNHHYQSHLLEQFSHIYSEYADLSPNNQLLPDVANRQQILFMQYEMEKRGKNLGMAQTRLFKIEEGHLFQVTDSSQQKPLPFPIEIIMIRRNNQQWQSKYEQFKAKIILKFTERSDITVFFREIIEWRQVGMFLQATIRHQKGKNFTRLAQNFTVRMAEKVADKIKAMKDACTNLQNLRVKAKLNQLLKDNLSDRSMMNAFLKEWKSKVHFQRRNVAALTLKFLSMKSLIHEKGTLILWVQGSATKKVNFLPASINKEKTITFQFVFEQQNSYQFLNISSDAEIQIEAEINNTVFKTQRFLLNDLEKAASRCKFFEMNLLHKGQIMYLKMSLESSTVSTYNKTIEISPRHYRVIDQLYLNSQSHFQLANIHEFYSQSLLKHRQLCGLSLSFTRVRTLCDMLGVQQLINKFFIVSPFKDYINIDNKGSAVYEYFIRNYQKEHFYDVEKLAWKIKDLTCKRVLFALKSFDENPKFNFTQPFLYLVQKIYDCAFTETINRWRINLFYKTIQGVQALAFFLSLAVVKSFSSLFIHQELVNKRALPYNSLLFTYVLRKYRPELNNKYDRLQLNIQAYFGHHFVSLFSCLLHDDLFACVLLKIVNDHQKQGQNLYISGLIALFFTIMDRIDSFKCSYLTAQHYILTFQEYCFNIEDKHALFTQMQKWQKTITEQSVSVEFNELVTELTDFYLANSYLGDLGEISRQIYQQFICYHYKNQMDLRKILLFIDKIQVGETCNQLNLTIFQSATKIYEHNFKGVDFAKLEHFVQLRLLKLQELNIICNNGKISLSCRVDPKELPSNLYFHMVKPLTLTYHMSPECNRNIFLQVYIKDNTQIDSLQNPLPKKYCEQYFEKGLSKEDLLFCKKFSKSFRMRENNFNLLYTKLGWFGNHYLIPEDRLLDIHTISLRQHQPNTHRIYALDRYTRVVYGKTILPRSLIQQNHVCVQLIKQGVLTTYQRPIISSNSNDVNHYSVANRLLCYCLDNFSIHSSMQFLQFYYKINQQLPLISYLSYKPKLFYDLPSFTFQVFNTVSTATVLSSHKGSQFLIDLSPAEIAEIEDRASWVSKLPKQFQFGYTNKKMQFDEYLYWLRLNILKKVGQLGEKKAKSRRWPNSLVSTTVNIPNYQLHNFYEVMNETKQIIQFEFKEIHKLCQPLCYSQFALIQNRWKDVHCIAQLNTSTGIYYYVIEKIQRKKYIVQDNKLIKTSPRQIKLVQLSDDIANSMEVVTYQLNKMFNL